MQILWEPWVRNWDEAWYAEMIKNMAVKDYGWLMPYWNGQYYFDHPPLYFWLSGLVVKLFGLGEWQVRIVSVISGVIATLLMYLIGKRLGDKKAGLAASLVWLTLGQVVVRIGHGNLEGLLVGLLLTTVWLWFKDKKLWAGISLGLGFLVKGWLVGLLPLVFIASYEVFTKRRLPIKQLLVTGGLGALVFGIWLVPGAVKFGQPFIQRYLFNPEAGRLGAPVQMFSLRFFEYLARDIGWWWIVIWGLNWKRVSPLLLAGGGYIFSLNFLNEKSDWYLIPVYPLLALSLGQTISGWWQQRPKMTALILAIIVPLQIWQVYKIETMYPDRSGVGAELGKKARKIVPKNEALVLDDHDFTSFLYYSDDEMVYVVEKQEKQADEWWRLKYEELPGFVEKKRLVWLVTPDEKRLPKELKTQEVEEYRGYKFLKITF